MKLTEEDKNFLLDEGVSADEIDIIERMSRGMRFTLFVQTAEHKHCFIPTGRIPWRKAQDILGREKLIRGLIFAKRNYGWATYSADKKQLVGFNVPIYY